MGRRGPPPTPTEILKLRGSWRANERDGEPQPESGLPACPRSLKGNVKVWRAVLRMFGQSGCTPTKPDAAQLERYCRYLIRWRRCEDEIDTLTNGGLMVTMMAEKSRAILRNLFAESHRCDETLKRTEAQFCLTPAARASVGMELNKKTAPADGIEAFARKRG